ncbi:MAG: DUF1579 domain-containing protein [Verrucomicrobiota bacterium]
MSATTTSSSSPKPATTPPCATVDMPQPTPAHAWLQRCVGEWDSEIEMIVGPKQPSMKCRGTDSARMVGGFWLVSEGKNLDFPYTCQLTLGYDPKAARYVGTWIDSMSSYLWHYTGAIDASGRLVLQTEGPFPPADGRFTKFREVTEFLTQDHRVFTSARMSEGGVWIPQLRIDFRRRG